MIHVYGVVDGGQTDVAVSGMAGVAVEIIRVDGLGVAVTRHAPSRDAETAETAAAEQQHAAVCDALQRTGFTVLPARCGLRYADEDALRRDLSRRSDALVASLRHVRGRVEIDVRLADPTDQGEDIPAAGHTVAHRSRAASRELAQAAANQIHELLRGSAVDAVTDVRTMPGVLLSAAYLVPADHARTFAAKVAELGRARTELHLRCTGPGPPYHFTGEDPLA